MARSVRILVSAVVLLVPVGIASGFFIHLYLGQESVAAWGNFLTGFGTMILALAALLAGWQGIKQYAARTREYADRTKAEQIRWVWELFGQLFQEPLYRRIRQKVDYDDLDDIADLLDRNKEPDAEFSQEERDLLDQFTDYLNFFELIAFLSAKKQLALEDVDQLFDYYLRRLNEIKQNAKIMEYLEKDGFENLRKLLLQYKSKE